MVESKTDRPDLEPGFWPEWKEPSALGKAIQYPLHDPLWQSRVVNAYVRKRPRPEPDKEG